MDNKERQELEDKAFNNMRNEGKNIEKSRQKNNDEIPTRSNRLWVWLGVIILIFIILYWLFAIGTFGDLANWFNG